MEVNLNCDKRPNRRLQFYEAQSLAYTVYRLGILDSHAPISALIICLFNQPSIDEENKFSSNRNKHNIKLSAND